MDTRKHASETLQTYSSLTFNTSRNECTHHFQRSVHEHHTGKMVIAWLSLGFVELVDLCGQDEIAFG